MLKKIIAAAALMSVTAATFADEASIRKAIQTAYPKVKVDSVAKTPYPGLYEVFLEGQIVYTDENFSFFIAEGRLIDTKTKKDLTSSRMEDLTRVDFKSLPLDQAIKVVRGNGSRKVVVFSDPDCPYCKKLEVQELAPLTDVTIYTFLYPLEGLHPDAGNKAKAIWCSADRTKAWNDWMFKGQIDKSNTSCDTPLEKNAELGRKLGVSSTPTLIFADGRRMLGAYPSKDIEKALNGGK
ncbi:thiol:disulfide interchange protein DsbC [Novimethylophilus kurashikiensis]|uniref:Thiol:disulfide interchange protein n=1 Tax=Novimethylophilus kurashikiensis TaxID=1825523 RepID=A0A2R5FBL5_9PROT|nr:DsbC family protein [Novimethylophilus kurashikiensis]GBG15607.1 thiol:disulfide interchange protein DsbC [Novimethylophilus kurashikiensis]